MFVWGSNCIIKYLFFFFFIAVFASAGCEKALDLKKPETNAFSIFDEAWNTLDQHYVFFKVKQVNWDSVYTVYHSQINEGMSEDALFNVIGNMMQTLRDGHVSLISSAKVSTYEGFYQLYLTNFNYSNVINYYLDNDYQTAGPFVYKINNGIGYIYYASFENNITDAVIDSLLTAMKDTKGLIIDVRNNTGGSTQNSDKFYQRFISERKFVKYEMQKKGKAHDDFFEPVPFYVSPQGFYYNKPVCVLTNRKCFSTCNDFVLYMSELPNVTLVGDNTGGGGGIPVEYLMANDWKMQYPATATLSPDKAFIEEGISPDINIYITPVDEMNGKDPILDKAIELLQ